MDGFILVDKEKGNTSFNVCNKIKYNLGLNKTGHSGTLDPNATGLMIVATNRATKLLKLLNYDTKEYITEIIFGLDSVSYDIDSTITKEQDMDFKLDDLKEKMVILKNKKTQVPPKISAIKVNGKKLMNYNEEIEINERNVSVIEDELISLKKENNHLIATIRLRVTKGFYIRSYAHDLGILLGGCAIVKELRRTKIEKLTIDDAKTINNITEDDIIPIDKFFDFKILEVDSYRANLAKNGVTFDKRQTTMHGIFFVKCGGITIAIYEETEENIYKPLLIF